MLWKLKSDCKTIVDLCPITTTSGSVLLIVQGGQLAPVCLLCRTSQRPLKNAVPVLEEESSPGCLQDVRYWIRVRPTGSESDPSSSVFCVLEWLTRCPWNAYRKGQKHPLSAASFNWTNSKRHCFWTRKFCLAIKVLFWSFYFTQGGGEFTLNHGQFSFWFFKEFYSFEQHFYH